MSLVVVVDAREVAFDTRITGPDRGLVGEAGVPARRLGPVYHFVEAADIPRQLMVAVTMERPVERSRISMELLQLPEGDRNARVLTAAYRYLAHGMKRVYAGTPSAWSERIVSLRNASQAFASMGNEEMNSCMRNDCRSGGLASKRTPLSWAHFAGLMVDARSGPMKMSR